MAVIRPGMPWSASTSASLHQLVCRVVEHWPGVEPLLRVPQCEADYDLLVVALVELNGIIGRQTSHPLASLVAVVELLMSCYECQLRARNERA
jgi:hypothetical protein